MGVQPIRKIVTPEIPDKLYFRIGDVARICEVPAYVLRFWETEFPQLKPNKGGTGQRLYRKRDVEMALRIKSLLYDQGYTIPGARQVFKNEAREREAAAVVAAVPMLSPAAAESVPEDPVASVAAAVLVPMSALAAVPGAGFAADSGAEVRRTMQLRAIRDELRSLLTLLETPRSGAPAPTAKPLRPRLMLEPRPAVKAESARPAETLRLLVRESSREQQGDLFPGE